MKKILISLILCTAAVAAAAQTDSLASGERLTIETVDRTALGIDTLRRIDAVESELVRLHDGGGDGSMILEVAGYGITLGQAPVERIVRKRPKVWCNVFSGIELGFTTLAGVDYAGYAPSERGFLDQRLGSSFHFAFSPIQLRIALNPSRSLTLGVGLHYTLDNYRLTDTRITIGNRDGRIVPVALTEPADKSKIVASYLGIPLRLTYEPVRHLRLTAVAYSDFLLGADAIYKKPKHKNALAGFRTYQFSLGLGVSYHDIGLFARYALTPLFRNDAGPDCHSFTFGIGLMF